MAVWSPKCLWSLGTNQLTGKLSVYTELCFCMTADGTEQVNAKELTLSPGAPFTIPLIPLNLPGQRQGMFLVCLLVRSSLITSTLREAAGHEACAPSLEMNCPGSVLSFLRQLIFHFPKEWCNYYVFSQEFIFFARASLTHPGSAFHIHSSEWLHASHLCNYLLPSGVGMWSAL